MERIIQVLIVEPNSKPKSTKISNTLTTLQKTVNGYIQVIPIGLGYIIICNDEAKLDKLQPNRYIIPWQDTICGTFIITKTDHDNPDEFASLNNKDIQLLLSNFDDNFEPYNEQKHPYPYDIDIKVFTSKEGEFN